MNNYLQGEKCIDNIEQTFASLHAKDLKEAVVIRTARRAYIMESIIHWCGFVYLVIWAFKIWAYRVKGRLHRKIWRVQHLKMCCLLLPSALPLRF